MKNVHASHFKIQGQVLADWLNSTAREKPWCLAALQVLVLDAEGVIAYPAVPIRPTREEIKRHIPPRPKISKHRSGRRRILAALRNREAPPTSVLNAIFTLSRNGLLMGSAGRGRGWIQKCAECETWFYARRGDMIYHRKECCERAHKGTPVYKAAHALDMRLRRAAEKKRDLRREQFLEPQK